VFVTILAIVVSLLTRADDAKYLRRLTYWSRHATEPAASREMRTHVRVHKVVPVEVVLSSMQIDDTPTTSNGMVMAHLRDTQHT
jgi:hypothetical protein